VLGQRAIDLLISRNCRDEQQTMIYSTTVVKDQTQLLKAEEIAAMLGLKVQTVYAMARRGQFTKVKLSRKCLRFRVGDVERFIREKVSVNS
jgi:excisionase family DNA binding protein